MIMTFGTGALLDMPNVGAGEFFGVSKTVFSAITFEDGLKTGRFAKIDAGSIDNFDGSGTPVTVGVVKRDVGGSLEAGGTIAAATATKIEYIRQGLVSVEVKTGETPSLFDRVYISNDGDANDGMATATNTDVEVNAEFIREIKTGVWLIYMAAAPGDVAVHIADALGAHAASAISLLDAATLTSAVNLEAAIAEILVRTPALVADPGDTGAIPVVRSSNVALTSGGTGETRTLAIPSATGITLDLSFDVDGTGDIVVTAASAINQATNTIMTFSDAGEHIRLTAVQVAGALVWRVVANDGVVLS
jgi:hypothetical protein